MRSPRLCVSASKSLPFNLSLRRLGRLLRRRLYRVAFEGARGGKFTQLVPHHILGNVNRDKFLSVMNREGMADELRKNGRTARPRAHHFLLIGRGEHGQLGFQMRVGKGSLLDGSAHFLTSSYSCASRSTCRYACCYGSC